MLVTPYFNIGLELVDVTEQSSAVISPNSTNLQVPYPTFHTELMYVAYL